MVDCSSVQPTRTNPVWPICIISDISNSVSPTRITRRYQFQYWENLSSFASCISVPPPLNDSCPLPASYFTCCFVMWLKDQTYSTQRSLPGNWCQRGREITTKLNHIKGGECLITSKGESPQMLGIQEERSHMSLRGEIHVSICYNCFALIFFSLPSPSIPYKIQGETNI